MKPLNIQQGSHIRVESGVVSGVPFTLATNYAAPDGSTVLNVSLLTVDERVAIGLYPVVETLPVSDERYQTCAPIYTINADHVALTYDVTERTLADVQQAKIAEVYAHCRSILDAASAGYSPVEIASFPALQHEIISYSANAVTGPYMQSVINRGRHTADSLSAALTPKIALEQAALTARDNHVAAILALKTPLAVADYDTAMGWPV